MTFQSKLFPLFLAALCFHAGCRPPAPEAPAGPELEGVVWRLSELAGTELELSEGVGPVTLSFNRRTREMTGFSGVNDFHAPYTKDGPALSFGPIQTTRREGPPPVVGIETELLDILSTDLEYRIADGQLELLQNATIVARFEPLAPGD